MNRIEQNSLIAQAAAFADVAFDEKFQLKDIRKIKYMAENSIVDLEPLTKEDIREIRERLNVSQSVFALLLCVETDTISKWEQGQYSPSGLTLYVLRRIQRDGADFFITSE